MENFQKINIAIIGLGKIAQKAYLPILTNHPKINPIFCTRNSSILIRLANQYRVKETYHNIDDVIKQQPDAAMVHSATDSHFQIISKLLHAGIPIFVDKPLCYTLKESEELLNIATQKKILLYLGFNRRFAPLIHSLNEQSNPLQIFWKKNRVSLSGDPRVFVFDDFIHVVDSLRYLGSGTISNLQVFSKSQNNQLEILQVQWQQNETHLHGSMNRISGRTEEQIEYYTKGNKWLIDELTTGFHFQNEEPTILGFGNWESTLLKRGFVNLIEDWLNALEENAFNQNRIQDIWETHNLCENIVTKIQSPKRKSEN